MTWAGHLPASREYRRILVGLGAAGVATFAQLYSPQGLLPTLARGLRVSPADAALSVSLATLGVAIAVLPWSWVADRVGRLRAMQVAIVASTVLGVLVALAPPSRSCSGSASSRGWALGGLPALAVTYLHDEVHARHTAAAAAAYISGTTVGGRGRTPHRRTPRRPRGLAPGAAHRGGRVRCRLRRVPAPHAASRGYRPSTATTARPSPTASARACATRRCSRSTPRRPAHGRLRRGLQLPRLPSRGAEFGLPAATVGSLIFAAYAAGTVSSRLTGRWVPRLGRRRVLLGGTLTMVVGALLTLSSVLAVVVVGLLVLTAGFFAAHATASAWVGARATTGRAQATALYNVFYYSGSALVGWVLGYAWSGRVVRRRRGGGRRSPSSPWARPRHPGPAARRRDPSRLLGAQRPDRPTTSGR